MPLLAQIGKPHLYVAGELEQEKQCARTYTNNPAILLECDALAEAIHPVVVSQSLSLSSLQALELGLRSKHQLVWTTAGRYLVILSHYFPEALDAILRLSRDRSADVRARIIQSQFSEYVIESVLDDMLKQGLADPSKKVRLYSASRCGDLKRKNLMEILSSQLTKESDETVILSIKDAIEILKKA
jgi:hypothetical protein